MASGNRAASFIVRQFTGNNVQPINQVVYTCPADRYADVIIAQSFLIVGSAQYYLEQLQPNGSYLTIVMADYSGGTFSVIERDNAGVSYFANGVLTTPPLSNHNPFLRFYPGDRLKLLFSQLGRYVINVREHVPYIA